MGFRDFFRKWSVSASTDTESEDAALSADDTTEEVRNLLNAYRGDTQDFNWDSKVADHVSGARILQLAPDVQVRVVLLGAADLVKAVQQSGMSWGEVSGLRKLVEQLMSRKLPLDSEHVATLCRIFTEARGYPHQLPYGRLAGLVDRHLRTQPMTPELQGAVRKLSKKLGRAPEAESRKLENRFKRILEGETVDVVVVQPGDAWADALLRELDDLPETSRTGWTPVLAHAKTATSAKPSARWLRKMSSTLR